MRPGSARQSLFQPIWNLRPRMGVKGHSLLIAVERGLQQAQRVHQPSRKAELLPHSSSKPGPL